MSLSLLPVLLLWELLSVTSQYVPHMPPFFFLCNYHGKPQQSNLDSGEVAISVSIAGNPENYRPEGLYEGEWTRVTANPLTYLLCCS